MIMVFFCGQWAAQKMLALCEARWARLGARKLGWWSDRWLWRVGKEWEGLICLGFVRKIVWTAESNIKSHRPWRELGCDAGGKISNWVPRMRRQGAWHSQILEVFSMLMVCLQHDTKIRIGNDKSYILKGIRVRWDWKWWWFGCPKCTELGPWNHRFQCCWACRWYGFSSC